MPGPALLRPSMRPLAQGAFVLFMTAAFGCGGCKKPSGGGAGEIPSGAVPVTSGALTGTAAATTAAPPPLILPSGQAAPLSFAPIAKRADPSVVTINTVGEEMETSFFSGRQRRRETKGLGTGFIVDRDGVIITNNHVIEGATTISVRLSDDRELPADVVGRDPRTDIAVIRLKTKDPKDLKGLDPLPMGDSDAIDVGDWVVAIGNPFGLSHTVSAGIISAKGRSKEDVPLDPSGYYNFLQTDASINPGNSGGPLLNLKGEVVGVNSAIRGGGAQGIGFAIPINMVKQLLPMLLRDGHVTRSALGVQIRDVRELPPEDRADMKITEEKGALIMAVDPKSGAAKAGLAPGDVIVAFEGQPIDRGSLLQWLASTAGVGKTVTIRVNRQGKVFDQKVTLGQLREPPVRKGAPGRPRGRGEAPDDE
jgi:serine protease Do